MSEEEVTRHNHMTRDMNHPNCPACAKYELRYGEIGKHVLSTALSAQLATIAKAVGEKCLAEHDYSEEVRIEPCEWCDSGREMECRIDKHYSEIRKMICWDCREVLQAIEAQR